MGRLVHLVFFISLLNYISAEYVSYEGYKVYKVKLETDKDVQLLIDLEKQNEYMLWEGAVKAGKHVKIMVEPKRQGDFEKYMESIEMKYQVAIDNVKSLIDEQMKRPANARTAREYDWSYYQTFEEILEWLDKIAEEHPDVVTLVDIGQTVEGRPIRGVIIDYKKDTRPLIGMLEGGIHAREWISPATLTWIINDFLTSDDASVRQLAETFQWHIFPVVNPDGYVYTFTDNRMWRKNRNQANFTSCSMWNWNDDMSNGIDLNRNFGFLWMETGASAHPCAEDFAGPIAFSEREAVAIANYVLGLQRRGTLLYYVAFHSYSQMILVPYSHVGGERVLETPNYADMYEIAIKSAEKLQERHNTEYIVGTSLDILYPVTGSSFDWVKGVAGVPIVFLLELRDDGEYGFLLPSRLIIPNNQEVVDALVEMDRATRQLGYYHSSGNIVGISLSLVTFVLSLNFL